MYFEYFKKYAFLKTQRNRFWLLKQLLTGLAIHDQVR